MPDLNFSTLPWATAVQQVADSAGASADTEMLARAQHSLRAAFQHLNNRYRWEFTLTEASPISVVAPFGVLITASAGQASASADSGHGILVDDTIVGNGFLLGTRVTATAVGGFGFNTSTTGLAAGAQGLSITAGRDFYDLPSDWKSPYSIRLLVAQRTLKLTRRRIYDRSITSETQSSTPDGYDIFQVNAKGKIRLVSPPAASDVMQLRYYRRMFIATASAASTALDCPEDFEEYPIAWAKWHLLTDKGQQERAGTWLSLANEGITTMLKEQTGVADEDLQFVPGHYFAVAGPNDVRPYLNDY